MALRSEEEIITLENNNFPHFLLSYLTDKKSTGYPKVSRKSQYIRIYCCNRKEENEKFFN